MGRAHANENDSMNRATPGVVFMTGLLVAFQPALADNAEAVGCDSDHENPAVLKTNKETEKDIYVRAYTEAECLRLAAAKAGAEWLKTESLLLRSQEESENEKWELAMQLVQQARFQAEAAVKQAGTEASAWKHRVVKAQD